MKCSSNIKSECTARFGVISEDKDNPEATSFTCSNGAMAAWIGKGEDQTLLGAEVSNLFRPRAFALLNLF